MRTFKLIGAAAISLLHINANAQKEQFVGISLHATVGMKQVATRNSFLPGAVIPSIASTLGAGPSWNINRAVIGSEFYYATAANTSSRMLSKYTGFNSNLYVGYQVVKAHGWQITPIVGIGKSKNQILVTSTADGQSSFAAHNNVSVAHTALRFEKVNRRGNYLGLKLGCNISTAGSSQWKSEGSNERVGASDNLSSFFLQLNIGGLITVKTY